MKNVLRSVLLCTICAITGIQGYTQEKDVEEKLMITIKKTEDGRTVVVDTIVGTENEAHRILLRELDGDKKELEIELELLEKEIEKYAKEKTDKGLRDIEVEVITDDDGGETTIRKIIIIEDKDDDKGPAHQKKVRVKKVEKKEKGED
ncbi:MAG: hypothetical protein IH599_01540 [Bacteroidales bacterium]|nr:hypothetical protein [Bacteroidales bacterium]